jgi:hypothetical protein
VFIVIFINPNQAYADRVVKQIGVDDTGEILVAQSNPSNSHGTCMASLAAGAYSSMGKKARLVTVQLDNYVRGISKEQKSKRALFAFYRIYDHAIKIRAQGNAVVTMSWGMLLNQCSSF